MIRKHLVFHGRVQGVGFRWMAKRAAEIYECTGWCRNEYNGTVTMELQGEEEDIDRIIQEIRAGRYVYIAGIDERQIPLKNAERGFMVRFS